METSKIKFIEEYSSLLKLYLSDASDDVRLFIASQFALESDFGTSRLFKSHNNICGMKIPYYRLTCGFKVDSSPLSVFSYYSCVYHSVLDYIFWLCYNKIGKRELKDLNLFKMSLRNCGYCPEKDYINRITSIYNQFKTLQNE